MAGIEIFIIASETNPVRLNVNGITAVVMVGVDSKIDELFLPALRDAHVTFRLIGEPGPAVAVDEVMTAQAEEPIEETVEEPAVEQPETPVDPVNEQDSPVEPEKLETPPVDDFKADEIITGNVKTVEARLAALNNQQLGLVIAAEKDREQPRSSILAAIDKLVAARA